jgi:hypothetical protein
MTRPRFAGRGWAALFTLATLAPGVAGAATLYGLIDTGALFASSNGGSTWTLRSTLPVRDAVSLVAGGSSSELYLATESGSVYRSLDAGANWTGVGTVAASDVVALVRHIGRLLLYTRSGSVLASLDGGATFSAAGAIAASDIVDATQASGLALALSATGLVHRSSNNGATWEVVATLPTSAAVGLAAVQGQLFALTATGDVMRASPPWTSWSFVGTLSQIGTTAIVAAGGELFASTDAGEIAASTGGASWIWRGAIGQVWLRSLGSDEPINTGVDSDPRAVVRFAPPWPNPSRGRFQLALEMAEPGVVWVEVFDPAGRRVAVPVAGEVLPAGVNLRTWLPGGLAGGSYYVRARTRGFEATRPVVHLAEK